MFYMEKSIKKGIARHICCCYRKAWRDTSNNVEVCSAWKSPLKRGLQGVSVAVGDHVDVCSAWRSLLKRGLQGISVAIRERYDGIPPIK